MKLKAIRITQPLGEFYITKIKAIDLLRISTSSPLRYDKDGNLKGNQRALKPDRLKLIANFIQSEEMCFPTSIIVAANVNDEGLVENESIRWSVNPLDNDFFVLNIPVSDIKTSLIIDGQHRLEAFKYVPDDFKDIELVCSVFFDLPSPYQAYLFATINGNQKRVDKSLSLELFGYSVEDEPQNTWSPEKLAVYLTRKFNFKIDSPLYQRIKLAPLYSEIEDKVDKSKWLLSTAAMVDGILKLISSNPQLDRDMLAIKKDSLFSVKTRKVLAHISDNTVLRNQYIDCKDDEIYDVLDSFFKSVKSILWDKASSDSVIVKTIGISVLFDILKEILRRNATIRQFEGIISMIKDVDYDNNYFQLSGIGKTRLRRVLKYKLGFIEESELEEGDHLVTTKKEQSDANEYFKRGISFADEGDNDKAIESFNEVIARNPQSAEAYYGRGNAYILKDKSKSIEDLITAIDLSPDYINAYYVLATVYEMVEKYENALDILQKGNKKAKFQGDLMMENQIEKEIKRVEKKIKEIEAEKKKEKFETQGDKILSYIVNQSAGTDGTSS